MFAKYKKADKFVEVLGDTTYYITIIDTAPEFDTDGNLTYFTKIEYVSDTINGFYYDAQSERYLEEDTDKVE